MAKTNSGLVEYCKKQVGKPYWFGTFGQTASSQLLAAKRRQYPEYYTASDFSSQYGRRVHDCAGLIKGYLWSDTPTSNPVYKSSQDYGATGFYNAAKEKGAISSFKKIPGQLVFKGNSDTKKHVGVYVGDDKVIEAKGHAYGVIASKFTGGGWTYWAQCHLIEKDDPQPTPTPPEPPKGDTYVVSTNGGTLSLRATPYISSSNVVTSIPNGTKLDVTEIVKGEPCNGTTDWAHTTYNGYCGFCTCSWLKKSTPDPKPQPTPVSKKYTVVAKSGLNVRSGPGKGYGIKYALNYGDTITSRAEQDDWVQLSSGGWACKQENGNIYLK